MKLGGRKTPGGMVGGKEEGWDKEGNGGDPLNPAGEALGGDEGGELTGDPLLKLGLAPLLKAKINKNVFPKIFFFGYLELNCVK